MKSSKDIFKNSLDKAFSTISLNASTLGDHMKYKQGFTEQSLEGGLADGKTLMDLAQKHAYDDSTDSTSKDKIKDMYKKLKLELDKGIKVEMEHTKSRVMAKEIAMDHLFEDPNYYNKLKKVEGKKSWEKSAKRQFSKDLQIDKDFTEFKKRAQKDNDNYGTPNVTVDDPYIKKRKWSRPGKDTNIEEAEGYSDFYPGGKTPGLTTDVLNTILTNIGKKGLEDKEDRNEKPKNKFRNSKKKETKEATGSGSSGAYSAPVFGGDDAFWERSRSETPKLKESDTEKVEAKEATTTGSSGAYETPSMWAKSTSKKDWGPSRKTQIPGGGFVKIKKKCTKFPYCNQGDITNVKISKNESVKEAIKSVAKKLNIGENVIITILEHEYEKRSKRNK
jgi:hypothetical protein